METKIHAYMFQAHLFCPSCILYELKLESEKDPTETVLNRVALFSGIDRTVEYSFDSNNFPKVAFEYWIRPNDPCERCGKNLLEPESTKRSRYLAQLGL